MEKAFDDIHVGICDLIEEGDIIAGRFCFTGVHVGRYMDCSPTMRKVEWEFLENFRVKHGQIVESWGYWPDVEIIHQLF